MFSRPVPASLAPRARFAGASIFARAGWLALISSATVAFAAAGIEEHPFASRSGPRGATMFTELSPEVTGVKTENAYADPLMRGRYYQEFETSSIGTGVAIGDYDGDGRPDIFVVSKTEGCRLFRNLGGFKFEDVTEQAGVGDKGDAAKIWKQGAAFVDVNNDGRLDLYVCRARAPNLLYINQGDGTFVEMGHAYGLDLNDSSVVASFCDYDRDGWVDVYIATNILDIVKHPRGQPGYLFHNNGNGTFTDVTARAGMHGEMQAHSATWWDYNNDGWPDLYVALDYGAPDHLYRNNRDGTFTDVMDEALPHVSFSSMGSDLGDVNNDGLIDFLVADMAATNHFVDQHSLADARGRTEERSDEDRSTPKYHRNALLLNTDTGHAQEAAFLAGLAATDWTWSLRFEDLDNDGRLDFFTTNGFPRDPGTDTVAKIMGAESPMERIRIMYASPIQAEHKIAMRNLGDLRFENVAAAWGLNQKGVSFGEALGDLDGDGDLDIVYANYRGSATVLRNDSDTGHRLEVDLRGTVSNRFGVGALVRIETAAGPQVRQLVVARGYMSSSEPMLHFGLGDETLVRRLTVTWPSGHVQTFENLPADRRFTITEPDEPASALLRVPKAPRPGQFSDVTASAGLAVTSREEPIDEISLQRLMPARFNRRGPALAVGDLLGQGAEAVVVGGTTVTPGSVIFGSAPHGFTAQNATVALPAGTVDDGPVLVFDADGDGRNDVLVTRGGNSLPAGVPDYEPVLYLNHGGLTPAPEGTLPELSTSVGAAAAADIDHDGRLDVFLGGRVLTGQYPEAPTSALWLNRGGKFEDVTDAIAPALRQVGMVTGALWSDVDGDGWVDLLLTLEWGPVKYFHNDGGRKLEDWTERAGFAAAGNGWWTGLAAADFNGDGRMDYLVGNVGLNTQYQVDAAHPALLFAGDFKGDGTTQLLEGYYEDGKLYPWRTRVDLGAVFPKLLKRYPTADSYASQTLEDIFGADKLGAAQRYAATELHSGVFLSQSDGTYRFAALPRIAQIAPFQGVVAGDFDGDGFADIYAVQNMFSPIPAVGRFDSGISQLLRGNGHGGFAPVAPADSGLVVTGDAKALVVLDLDRDGWPDFVVSRNYGSTLAFRNAGVAGRHSFSVRLHGPAGNALAVGARISVELTDGTTQTSDVSAGSGYYSQSSASCFFGYVEGNPPRRVRVRWPDGRTTEEAWPSGAGATVEISAP
jgi:hypothetical protein